MPRLTEYQEQFVEGLRALAAFLEEHPDFIGHGGGDGLGANDVSIDVFLHGDGWKDFLAAEAELRGARVFDLYCVSRRAFGPHRVDVNIPKERVPLSEIGSFEVLS